MRLRGRLLALTTTVRSPATPSDTCLRLSNPWNYPLLLAAWKVAPALAAGNAVLLKPSEETPLATRRLAELMHELPDGLLQVLYGAGEVGSMLVRHPGVDMVALTGSQETGRKVSIAAAERLIPVNLELGGKDPFIICDDVEAVDDGATLVAGGERYGERGFFYKPTVLTGVTPSMTVMRDETFGPVVPVVEVGSLDEAIEQANSVPFGLGANVYTQDFGKMLKCMRELRAGTVWVNDPLTDNDAAPFGGQKGSGIGRELGREGLEAFQESKHVHIDPKVEKKEWWYPYGPGDEPGQRTM